MRYFDAWLRGRGVVPLDGLMEDAATAEIAWVQFWQWLRHHVVDREGALGVLDDELGALDAEFPWAALDDARVHFERIAQARELPPRCARAGLDPVASIAESRYGEFKEPCSTSPSECRT